MQVCSLQDPASVKVEWYYDVPTRAATQAQMPAAGGWLHGKALAVSAWSLSGLALAVNCAAGGCADPAPASSAPAKRIGRPVVPAMAMPPPAWHRSVFLPTFLKMNCGDFLDAEHPQTVALILAHSTARSAGILTGLSSRPGRSRSLGESPKWSESIRR